MKIRQGFVSNSSSSSFVCDICSNTQSGWDLSYDEADMFECEFGHVMCNSHANKDIDDLSDEEILEILEREVERTTYRKDEFKECLKKLKEGDVTEVMEDLQESMEWRYGYNIPEICCPVCNFEHASYKDLAKFLEKENILSRDEVFAEIKKINKRRKKLYDIEYVERVCLKLNKPILKLLGEIKEKYKKYSEFKKAL